MYRTAPVRSLIYLALIIALLALAAGSLTAQRTALAQQPPTPEGVVATAVERVNIRFATAPDAAIIGVLLRGQAVLLDGKTVYWYRFTFTGSDRKGWVKKTAVTVTGDLNKLPDLTLNPTGGAGQLTPPPIINPPSDSGVVPGGQQPTGVVVAQARGNVIIRGCPSERCENLGIMSGGATVQLDGRSLSWYRFSFVGSAVKGWLPSWRLQIFGDPNNLPDVTFPPNPVVTALP
jgi:hypothetical protein